jgi:hypothetical protein
MLTMKTDDKDKCSSECKTTKNDDCCFQKCFIREKGILGDGKFQKDKFIDLYSEAEENLSSDWKKVILKSVNNCTEKCTCFYLIFLF